MTMYMYLKKLILTINYILLHINSFHIITEYGICCKMTIVSTWPCKNESKKPK